MAQPQLQAPSPPTSVADVLALTERKLEVYANELLKVEGLCAQHQESLTTQTCKRDMLKGAMQILEQTKSELLPPPPSTDSKVSGEARPSTGPGLPSIAEETSRKSH